MGLFDRFFKTENKPNMVQSNSNAFEHAVIIRFVYGIESLEPLFELEKKLESVINETNTGEYDGHEIAMDYSDGFLYMFGANAEVLYKAVRLTLVEIDFMKGAKAKLRFGPPSNTSKEIEIEVY